MREPIRKAAAVRLLGLALALGAASAAAQPAGEPPAFKPSIGQEGKDVIWFPTPQALVDKMLAMARVTSADYLIDLGSGDGRTVITAARRGVRASGIEYNPDLVEYATRRAEMEGVADKASFVKADLFDADLSRATVITLFLLERINVQLRPKLLALKPGTRIVSNTFRMGDWVADERAHASKEEGCLSYCVAYLWIVPANVVGTWKLTSTDANLGALAKGELTLRQAFQVLTGELATGDRVMPVAGRVSGDLVTFTADGSKFAGRIGGDRMVGTGKGRAGRWSAVRTAKPPPAEEKPARPAREPQEKVEL